MITMNDLKESVVWEFLSSKEEAECFIDALNTHNIIVDLDCFIDCGKGLSIEWAIIPNSKEELDNFIKEYNDSRIIKFDWDDFYTYENKEHIMFIHIGDVTYFNGIPKIKSVDLEKKQKAIEICDALHENGYIFKLNERYLDDGIDFIKVFCRDADSKELCDLFVLNGFDASLNVHGNIVVSFAREFPRLSMSECFSNK